MADIAEVFTSSTPRRGVRYAEGFLCVVRNTMLNLLRGCEL